MRQWIYAILLAILMVAIGTVSFWFTYTTGAIVPVLP